MQLGPKEESPDYRRLVQFQGHKVVTVPTERHIPKTSQEKVDVVDVRYLFDKRWYTLDERITVVFDEHVQVNPVLPACRECLFVISAEVEELVGRQDVQTMPLTYRYPVEQSP